MSYFHVRLYEQGRSSTETKLDLAEESLEAQFLAPYRDGRPITVNGRSIPLDRLTRIRVSRSEEPSADIINKLRAQEAGRRRVVVAGGPSIQARAAAAAEDVTDEYVTGPPGGAAVKEALGRASGASEPGGAVPDVEVGDRANSVFVVNGRDAAVTSAVVQFLLSLNIQVVEWEHAVERTGLPAPYVGDVVMTGFKMATATLVLITPDDVVTLREDLRDDDDKEVESQAAGQARPNVYYEAGIADALGRERTVIVEVGNVKTFSDISGRHVVKYDGTATKRNVLAQRLRAAGLSPNTTGSNWLSAGDVTAALQASAAAIAEARGQGGAAPTA